MAGGIDYNTHYRTAYEKYNEAVTYYDLNQRGTTVHNIPETKSSTPDFEANFNYRDFDGVSVMSKVYVEVKSLGFADGNNEYLRNQRAAFESNLDLEEQRKRGRYFCSSIYTVSPLADKDTGPTSEIEEFNKKIKNNIKEEQFTYGDGNDSILYVDFSQYLFPFNNEECLPVYPDIIRKYCASGRLWMLAFGREGERIFSYPEFEGRACFDRDLTLPGILNSYDFIKGIIFSFGSGKGNRKLLGLYRFKDAETKVAVFLHQVCDYVNDDLNTYGFEYYNALQNELKQRCSVNSK